MWAVTERKKRVLSFNHLHGVNMETVRVQKEMFINKGTVRLCFGRIIFWAIASCTISLHPIPAEKTKLSLKKISEICVLDFFFRNEILYYGFFYPE